MAAFAREQICDGGASSSTASGFRPGVSRDLVVSGAEIRQGITRNTCSSRSGSSAGPRLRRAPNFADGAPGEVGIIAPVTEPFRGACSRIASRPTGRSWTCLFSKVEHSLRDVRRSGATTRGDGRLYPRRRPQKEPRHYINETFFEQPARTMSLIAVNAG